jgi:hypothetical protein
MTVAQIESVITNATAALTDWNSFVDGLSSLEGPDQVILDLEKPLPSLSPPTSITQIGTKLTGAIGLVHNLAGIESLDLIPDLMVTEITARVSAVRAAVDKLVAQLDSLEKESEIISLDVDNMTIANANNKQINLVPIFIELYPLIQNLLVALYQLRTMSGLSEEGGFTLQLAQIQAARSAQQRAYGDLSRLRRALDTNKTKLDSIVSTAQVAAQEVAAIRDQTTEAAQKTEEGKSTVEALVATAAAINEEATKLKTSIDAYQPTFNKFQAELDERDAIFVKGKAELEKLLGDSKNAHEQLLATKRSEFEIFQSNLAKSENEMDRLLARSRDILGEATVSGLSESFAREMKTTGRQLRWIQILFYFSIAFLLAAAGIVLDAFPWLSGWVHTTRFEPPANADPIAVALFYLGNFVSKLTFLLPPLILLFFAARRYTELFRLKTHYTYKYTVAASLPGFKIEAPAYADAITASAFKELLFNPGEKAEGPEDRADGKGGNTFLQRLIEPVVRRAIDKMGNVPKTPP